MLSMFDLDGVLTSRDSMAALVTERLRQKPVRLIAAVPVYLLSLIAGSHSSLAARSNRLLVRLALHGLDEREYRHLATRTGKLLVEEAGFIRQDMRDLCASAAASSPVIVVTASELHLARAIVDAAGLTHVELLGSRLSFNGRASRFALHNVGPQKLRSLETAGVNFRDAIFYTDSASDLPLALAAAETVLVHPRKAALRRLRAARPDARLIR